ncbi:MAG: mercuric transport protein periplasmic component [Nitrospirae bacterium CG08_land_8_20_14_0_20_52_24]|nr:MAG: mercuric transport protein periplasmic component [Nitrospirae bacterium CG08_land_8_20_14_0_20_52_24]PIV82343.1 MAG: mercuric transport protein periplasmic component [Nitrospirae bacterium CG17_big_fil_post_rev_8_21_14_2_50_50_9]PIW86057.1 MAG: mercuric transport protein periplasmic component [Nitrospirae bacterium CG_4_8_14_3_um_filter_50_41]PIX86665.1 MAG: mercuric transport protein periplasmic component [Nitrospirae bacterium CG_4_10_14_3_um_filter_53_41]
MIIMMFISLITIGVQHASAESRTVTLQVENMTCGVCTHTVKKSLKKVSGVTDAKVTLDPPEAIVTFDDIKATLENLTQATGRAGYPSKVIRETE